jgi:hypothetical protein
MQTSSPPPRTARISRIAQAVLPIQIGSLAFLLLLASCASPGDPIERKPQVYAPVSDLAAAQSGNTVVLTFTIPKETADHRTATTPPAVEIYRAIHATPGASSATGGTLALLVTVPASMVPTYIADGKFRYVDPLTSGDFLTNDQQSAASYTVRTRASAKKESADSNRAKLNIYPASLPIIDLQAQAAESAINLTWSAPQTTLTGSAPAITGYKIYRASAAASPLSASVPSADGAAAPSTAAPKLTSPLTEIGESTSPQYRDTDVQPEKSYVYSVRSTIAAGGSPDAAAKPLESADSNMAAVTLHDIYPPSVPTQVIVTPVPAEPGTPPHMDLSWNINPETDLAGYNIYRSDQAGAHGARVNTDVLPTPAFSDSSAQPGHTYYYSVTAVDRTGNESVPSAAVRGTLNVVGGNQTP